MIVKQRASAIRKATPDVLKELFEMQNRRCDLCGHPIQDLICAALDHSIPVIWFARSAMPIEQAIAEANAPKNLRCAHTSCNHHKHDKTREEWFAQGLNNRNRPRLLTADDLLTLQFRLGAGGRIGGRNNSHENHVRAGRLGGHISGPVNGRKMAESGHLARISSRGGTATEREDKRQAGRLSGHRRWHIARGLVNSNCKLCMEAL